jgi:hypothetical protein
VNRNHRDESRKQHARQTAAGSLPEQLLAHSQAGREIVQDFVASADSLEWSLGQEYLRQRGNKAFLSDASPVPFVVNNDGSLSKNAAEVFFASLVAADKARQLEGDIFVLELGIGVGLFARYFLDHFQEQARRHRTDYYDRVVYIAADRSERMLQDLLRHGVLSGHPGRYRVRQVDAMRPEELLRELASGVGYVSNLPGGDGHVGNVPPQGPLRAVFLNYLLDCVPAAVLEFDGERVRQLCADVRRAPCAIGGLHRLDRRAAAAAGAKQKPAIRIPKQIPSTKSERTNERLTQHRLRHSTGLSHRADFLFDH